MGRGRGQDITERKQVEVEKARVAQELQTFIDTANAPIFGIDDAGKVRRRSGAETPPARPPPPPPHSSLLTVSVARGVR